MELSRPSRDSARVSIRSQRLSSRYKHVCSQLSDRSYPSILILQIQFLLMTEPRLQCIAYGSLT
jgi:hypothetical protein